MAKTKKVLWLHTQPEHYFNLMIDDLNDSSDFEYVAAFVSKGPGWYSELPVPKKARSIFLRIKPGCEKSASVGFRNAHINWREDINLQEYAAVIVPGYAGYVQRAVIKECHKLGIPLMIMSDSNIRSERGKTLKHRLKRRLKKIFLRPIIKKADVLLPTNSLGAAYWRYYGAPRSKIVVSAYYADYARIEAARSTDRSTVLKQFGLPAEKDLLFSAARLVPVKGLDLMIRAFRELNLGEKGYIYAIAGVGPLEAELKNLAGPELNKSIFFLGFVQPADLMKLMVHAALFVLPSRYEPHGIVIGEAAAAGTPQLVSDVCGAAKDVIVTGKSGWTFRSDDANSFIQALSAIVSRPEKLKLMRCSSMASWRDWFKWTNPVDRVDMIIRHLLKMNAA